MVFPTQITPIYMVVVTADTLIFNATARYIKRLTLRRRSFGIAAVASKVVAVIACIEYVPTTILLV